MGYLNNLIFTRGNHMNDWSGDHAMNGWGAMWMLFITVIAIGVILVVIYLFTKISGNAKQLSPPDPMQNAKSILADRFAKGEIASEEYRERLAVLDKN